jgi:acyl-CoA reductase-like NAD-dependent aldehyde dehydrogenase
VDAVVPGGDGEAPEPALLLTSVADVRRDPDLLAEEMFGPASLVVQYDDAADLVEVAGLLTGQLTATVHAEPGDDVTALTDVLTRKAGRLVLDGWPTGVTVSHAQHHGGPFPATTAAGTTSVGTAAVRRFVRPVAFQGFPDDRLPPPLQESNPWGVPRRVDGRRQPGRTPA